MTESSFQSTPSVSALSFLSSHAEPPSSITLRGEEFLLVDHTANRRKSSTVSKIWHHGQDYISQRNPSLHAWRCGLCDKNWFAVLRNTSTSDALRHLQGIHGLDIGSQKVVATKRKVQEEVEEAEQLKQPRLRQLIQTLNIPEWRRHLMRWIIRNHIPFTAVEDEDFKGLLTALNQSIGPYLVTGDSVRNWLKDAFLKVGLRVKELLANALSRIHVSFDLWTSPNGLGICGICAHFVGPECRNRSVLIGLKRMKYSHSGESTAEQIVPVLQEFGVVGERVGVFVADNAEVNDVAIKEILQQLRPDIKDPRTRRGRCLGHILNLAAQAFIFGKDVAAFEESTLGVDESTPIVSERMKKAQKAWRERGSIGKLHNIIVSIRISPQRRERFMSCTTGDPEIDGKWKSSPRGLPRRLTKFQTLWLPSHIVTNQKAQIAVKPL
jgi:hypothetical protein